MLCAGAVRSPCEKLSEGYDGEWKIPYRCAHVPVLRAPLNMLFYAKRAAPILIAMLEAELRQNSVRAVLFYGSSYYAFDSLFELCRRAGVPSLTYEVEYPISTAWPRLLTGGYFDHSGYIRATLRRASGLIGISSFWAPVAESLGLPFQLIPSYLPDEIPTLARQLHSRGHKASGVFHVVTLGRWGPRECPRALLRGVRDAHCRGIPIRYTAIGMIGGGLSDYRIWKMCERDPVLREVVTMTGWLEATEKTALMQSADVFVILRRETRESAASFPTRLPEYLATGRPVIASAAGDIPEYLEHGVTAWLVPPDDRGELLCSAFVTLHAHPELGDAIGRAGFDEAVKRFSIEENGRKMDAFIRSLALGASAGKAAPAH